MNTSVAVPSNIKAFLFDLDGVIIDSEKIYTEIWAEIDRQFPTGIPDFPIVIKGTTLDNILDTYYPDAQTRKRVEELLYDLEGKIQYKVITGADILLHRLKEANVPMALVTSSNDVKMKNLWQQLPSLKEMFRVIVTADMISHSKPHPEGYLKAAEKLGVRPEDCVVVEDSLQGVNAGANAGAFVIGVTGTIPEEKLRSAANMVTDDLSKVRLPF